MSRFWLDVADQIEQLAEDCAHGRRIRALRECRRLLAIAREVPAPIPPHHLPTACRQIESGDLDRAYWALRRAAVRLRREVKRNSPNAP